MIDIGVELGRKTLFGKVSTEPMLTLTVILSLEATSFATKKSKYYVST